MEIILPSLAERLKPLRKEKKRTRKEMADYFRVAADSLPGREE